MLPTLHLQNRFRIQRVSNWCGVYILPPLRNVHTKKGIQRQNYQQQQVFSMKMS